MTHTKIGVAARIRRPDAGASAVEECVAAGSRGRTPESGRGPAGRRSPAVHDRRPTAGLGPTDLRTADRNPAPETPWNPTGHPMTAGLRATGSNRTTHPAPATHRNLADHAGRRPVDEARVAVGFPGAGR
ncbi:hypothetical protein GCM10022243_11880 [Saccharothrix violaceirubra]|uniref:Uncharacterized protein n=1 Tax=Saccharothrix violaceirubra TaxID=413306 RepID=A0A7W7WYX4_9PSEU|nr:hypothetical protein [Saccharothrix violaceirubra]